MISLSLLALRANAEPKLRYEVTEIFPISDDLYAYPAAINNHGVIVGGVLNEVWRPVVYRNGVMESLPVAEGLAGDINDAGDPIVQSSALLANYLIRAGVPILLQSDTGQSLYAYGLNNHGEVAGFVHEDLSFYAAAWSNGVIRRLGPITPGRASLANDINDSGEAVGTIYEPALPNDLPSAVLFREGQMIPLGGLPGHISSEGQAINARGDVLCHSQHPYAVRSFLVRAGSIVDLGAVPGGTQNYVYGRGLNNLGDVVGSSFDERGRQRAFLYRDGAIHDLTGLVKPNSSWTFLLATAINDKGQIVGVGDIDGRQYRAFLLNPKKELRPKPSR